MGPSVIWGLLFRPIFFRLLNHLDLFRPPPEPEKLVAYSNMRFCLIDTSLVDKVNKHPKGFNFLM